MLKLLLSGASSVFGGVWGYVGVGVVALAVGGYGGYRFELSTYEARVAADALAQSKAVTLAATAQKASDDVSLKSAVAEATAQQRIVTQTVTITKEIPAHVPATPACIPYGLVRVLNDAANPGTGALSDAAGQPDDACAPISWRDFAADLAADYGTGHENAEQLNALETWVSAQENISTPAK